jgi:hypothetical protein
LIVKNSVVGSVMGPMMGLTLGVATLVGCGGAPFTAAEGSEVVLGDASDGGPALVIPPGPALAEAGVTPGLTPTSEVDAGPGQDAQDGQGGQEEQDAKAADADLDSGLADAADAADAACVPLEHNDGWTSYSSCDPLGTDSADDALLACQAYVAALDPSALCVTEAVTGVCPSFGQTGTAICANTPPPGESNAPCWVYQGATQGQIVPYPYCATSTTWN